MRTPFFWDREKMDILLRQALPRNAEPPYCHHPYTDFKSLWRHPLIEWADIIHLHWVSGLVTIRLSSGISANPLYGLFTI